MPACIAAHGVFRFMEEAGSYAERERVFSARTRAVKIEEADKERLKFALDVVCMCVCTRKFARFTRTRIWR